MPRLTVAIFWNDDDEKKTKPRVHPGRLVIDKRDAPTSVEFHSFVEEDVKLFLPPPLGGSEMTLPPGKSVEVPIGDPNARGCFRYRVRFTKLKKDAKGGSMPRMIILP